MNNKPVNYGATSSTGVKFEGGIPAEYNSICENVVTNIYTINSSWKSLDSSFKNLGTARDNRGLRDKMYDTFNLNMHNLLHFFTDMLLNWAQIKS